MPVQQRIAFSGHSGSVYTLDNDGYFVYTGSGDQFVAKWNSETGTQEAFSIKCDHSVYKIRLLRNKEILAIGTSSGSLHLIHLKEKKELKHYIQHQSAIFEISENPLKNHFYTTDADGNLAVWDLQNFGLLLFLPLAAGKIRCVCPGPSGEFIYLACQDGDIRVLDTEHFNETNRFPAHAQGVNCLNFFPGRENMLISGGKDGFLRVWKPDEGPSPLFELAAHNFGIYRVVFFKEGKNFVSISRDKSIKYWDAKKLEVLQKIERKHGGHSHAVNAIAKINESEFVTAGDDKRIIRWEIPD